MNKNNNDVCDENKNQLLSLFKDKVYVFSFISAILYALLFYVVSTNEILSDIHKHNFVFAETLRKLNESGLLEVIPFIFIWIIYLLTIKFNFQYLDKKRNIYCFGYGLFMFPLTFMAFWVRGRDALTIKAMLSNSLIFSVYRIIGSILLLILVNVIIELIVKVLKKYLFKLKQENHYVCNKNNRSS